MPKWAILVTFASGEQAYLRHGEKPGHGRIVVHRTRELAEINLEMITPGLEDGDVAAIVPATSTEPE